MLGFLKSSLDLFGSTEVGTSVALRSIAGLGSTTFRRGAAKAKTLSPSRAILRQLKYIFEVCDDESLTL